MPDDNINIVPEIALTGLEARLQFMQDSDDFPALSTTINDINNVVSSETSSTQNLTSIILEDFSLTNNLLKVVNTVSYGQFGGKINTISKAVVILGFDVVRNIATSLILLDFLQNKPQAEQLKDHVISAYFLGLVSRQLTLNLRNNNYEEAMICGIFHNLGELLSSFYFFDENKKVGELIASGMSETEASRQVLGVSYDKLGLEIAKSWNLPERLTYGMQPLKGNKVGEAKSELDKLKVSVNLASELTSAAATTDVQEKHKTIQQLVSKYKNALSVDADMLQKSLDQSLNEIAARSNILKFVSKKTKWLKRVADYSNETLSKNSPTKSDKDKQSENVSLEENSIDESSESTAADEVMDREMILQAGIQEVINSLVGEYNMNELIQMILETMYRGLQCHRVLLFIRDGKTKMMQARSGYGPEIDQDLPKFKFPLAYSPDVFHLSVDKGVDIVIVDTNDRKIASKIPHWYPKVSSARSFLLLPVMVNKKAVGCFYADMQDVNGFDEASKSLGLLRTLRNQAVLAIKQS